jgi:uncharacterized protein YjbI with pentapeptide repeats
MTGTGRRALRRAWLSAGSVVGALVAVGTVVTIVTPSSSVWRELGLAILSGAIVGGTLVLVETLLSDAAAERAEHASLLAQLSTTIDLNGIDLRARDLTGLYLPDRSVVAGQLANVRLDNARLFYGNYRHAIFTGASMRGSDFGGASLAFADLTDADLAGASLCDVDLSHAVLSGADLSDVDLTGARIQHTNFGTARLDGARFVNCYLQGSDLSNASLVGATFEKIEYDERTLWPAQFVPPPSVAVSQPPISQMKLDRYLEWRASRS